MPTKDVVHMPVLHHFWSKNHFDKPAAAYSFAEEDLNPTWGWLKSALKDFITSFKLEQIPNMRYLRDPSNRVPKPIFLDTMCLALFLVNNKGWFWLLQAGSN